MIFTLSIRRCRRSFFTCLPPFPFLHPHPAFLTCSSFHSRASCQPATHPHHPCQRRAGDHPSAWAPKLNRLPADGTIRHFLAAAEIHPSCRRRPGEVRGSVISAVLKNFGTHVKRAVDLQSRLRLLERVALSCIDYRSSRWPRSPT